METDQKQLRSAIAMALEAVLLNTTDFDEAKVASWIRKKIAPGESPSTGREGGTSS